MKLSPGERHALRVDLSRVSLLRGGRRILDDISWRVAPGQFWVLLGANGSGKTQLQKLLAGDVWPAPDGRGARHYTWRGETSDEPLGIKEHIAYVGAERQDRYEHYEWNYRVSTVVGTGLQRSDIPEAPFSASDRQRIDRLLRQAGIAELAARRFLTLSYGQRRLVLLARALAWRPALLLLDEVLNGLDQDHRARMLALIARVDRRIPVVYATHRLEDVPPRATHLLEVRAGRVHRQMRWRPRAMARTRPAATRQGAGAPRRPAPARTPIVWLSARNASVWLDRRLVLRGLAFDVAQGECWVVHGPNGSGKSTLLRALYGDIGVASQGEIKRRGIDVGVPISEFKARVGLVAPELQAAHPLYATVLDTVVSGCHSSLGLEQRATRRERQMAAAALRRVGGASLQTRELRGLSYGQMRRVLFARALVNKPAILLLDEPYTGLDTRTRALLQRRVAAFLRAGGTVVMCTHHRDEWPATVTHELQLRAGRAGYCGAVRAARHSA